MQDYLELTNAEGRMNTPSVAEGNWTWRISPRYRTVALTEKIKNITSRTGRATK
jgi:4-alpha-glucanotransferase